MEYFQDLIAGNHCFGCGPDNVEGLQIKSAWSGERQAVCTFTPAPHHCAATRRFVNGGIIATIIDCHCVCTAIAWAYKRLGRRIGTGASLWYATAEMALSYRRPVPIEAPITLSATILADDERRIELAAELTAAGKACVTASVAAVAVPESWMG